jgi:ABC-2 type transport system permease protein
MESFICGSNATQAMLAMGNPQPEYRPAQGSIEDQPFSVSGLMPDAMDYYAVTMLVMIVMYGTMYGAYGMAANNLYPVGRRVKASPVRPGEQYIGTTIGNVATIFVSSLVIIAFSHFAYGVNWGDNLFLILLITFLHVILAVGLGSMAIAVMRDEKRASVLINLLVIAWTFLAGGYFKITLPSAFSWIQYFSPSFLVQTALFNTIYGGPFSQTLLMLAAMIGIILLSGIIGIAAERRSGQ